MQWAKQELPYESTEHKILHVVRCHTQLQLNNLMQVCSNNMRFIFFHTCISIVLRFIYNLDNDVNINIYFVSLDGQINTLKRPVTSPISPISGVDIEKAQSIFYLYMCNGAPDVTELSQAIT